ncbi:PREDICTED: uncharacterized protein LOC108765725 [Trachymyrmex cornetzi]|uniref:uncharacterized protein LOC108765725 n=1 Tax=Trachymyrmex cornetzi TaxID=471704 RepID=UPI00084F6DBC|nr:PREDICTED: uncharacterized protein LOC108765725 [Trachymyrmex cornetzi]
MYRQIMVHPTDRDLQRIFWQDANGQVRPFQLTTVTYGLNCAPFLALSVLQQLIADEGHRFPKAIPSITKGRYVDDIFGGTDSVEEAKQIITQVCQLCLSGGFPLRKWSSNCQDLLDHLSLLPDDVATAVVLESSLVKVLGLCRQPHTDMFKFTSLPPTSRSITKRSVLSEIAQLYDPLGFISPFVIRAKIFIQNLWLAKVDWDAPLSSELQGRWTQFKGQLPALSKLNISRWLHISPTACSVELHGFSDALQLAIAAVVYVRVETHLGTQVNIVCAKTKVAPLKKLTIPRLELNTALMPSWLSLEPINWPHLHPITPAKIDLEKNPKRAFISHQVSQTPPWDLIERYSSLTKLIRITAICKHVVTWFRQSLKESNNGSLTTLELQESCQFYIRQIQKSSFQQEIKLLTRGERLSKSNPLIKLTPFIDKVGLLRVGGRLQHANLEADVEHPFTLPRQSRFTTLVVADAHLRTMHGRTQVTLAYIRQKYWIIGGRAPVRSFILRCVKCLRYRQSRAQQLMDQLLELKVTPSRPFLHSGVDYAGPISIKTWRGRAAKTYKGYLVIFVCFSTSAVHIEIVTDYTTEAFISAYKRFTARRGICATLHSDCGVASNIATSNLKAQHWKVRHAENNIDCAHKRTGEGSQLRHLNASVE